MFFCPTNLTRCHIRWHFFPTLNGKIITAILASRFGKVTPLFTEIAVFFLPFSLMPVNQCSLCPEQYEVIFLIPPQPDDKHSFR
jgi:hypothetical protein